MNTNRLRWLFGSCAVALAFIAAAWLWRGRQAHLPIRTPASLEKAVAAAVPPPDAPRADAAAFRIAPADETQPRQDPGTLHAAVTDRAGRPVRGAALTLALSDSNEETRANFPRRGTTDIAGEIQFANLPWGKYILHAEHDKQGGWGNAAVSPAHPAWSLEIVLRPTGVIKGTVVDTLERPLYGVSVDALDQMRGALPPRSATTGEDGRFSMDSLPLSRYALQASAAGYAPGRIEEIVIGGPPVRIVLDSGIRLDGLVQHCADQSPQAGVAVRIVAADYEDVEFRATSDAQGAFHVEDLPEGLALITSDDARFALIPPQVSLKVSGPDVARVKLQVDVAAGIAGRVYDKTSGAPVVGAIVEARDATYRSRNWLSAPTDAGGRYRLASLTPGTLTILLDSVPAPYDRGMNAGKQDLVLQPGETQDDVDFVLTRGLTVCGVVVDERDAPVPGATVSLGKTDPRDASPFDFRSTSTDGSGAFCFSNLQIRQVEVDPGRFAPERLCLEANFRGRRSDPLALPDLEGSIEEIRLVLRPRPGGAIAGVIVDVRGQPAVASLRLTHPYVDTGFDLRIATTDIDGHFLFQDLGPGDFEIWIAPDNGTGYNAGKQLAATLTLAAGQRVMDLRLVAREGGFISGTLRDASGAPLQGVNIEAWDVDAGEFASAAFTDRDGRFRITNVDGEAFDLRPRDFGPGACWHVPARPGEDVEIVLTPELLQTTADEPPPTILDPETGEERLARPEDFKKPEQVE